MFALHHFLIQVTVFGHCYASHYIQVCCHFVKHITHLLIMNFTNGAIQYTL